MEFLDKKSLWKIFSFCEKQWKFHNLQTLFDGKDIHSFSEFSNGFYRLNMNILQETMDIDGEIEKDDIKEEDYIMDVGHKTGMDDNLLDIETNADLEDDEIMKSINVLNDELLFSIDDDNQNISNLQNFIDMDD